MPSIAIIAHKEKTFGGGLEELRAVLAEQGIVEPLWYELTRSREAPRKVAKCLKKGVELILVWGGDGTVQSCIDALVSADPHGKVELAILPAGTANMLATNLGIPQDIRQAVEIALHGARRRLDVGRINGEHFAAMAGTGFDAQMIRDAGKRLKESIGRVAYIWTGLKNLRNKAIQMEITLDGERWFRGRATCVLLGNVGTVMGGLPAFPDAEPTDGLLNIGVINAESGWDWMKVLGHTVLDEAEKSPLVTTGRGRSIKIKLASKLPYQIDGGARPPTTRLRIKVRPLAIPICVPASPPAEHQPEPTAPTAP